MHKHIVTHIFSIDYGLLFFDFKNRSRKQYVDNLNLIFSKISCSCVDANYVLVHTKCVDTKWPNSKNEYGWNGIPERSIFEFFILVQISFWTKKKNQFDFCFSQRTFKNMFTVWSKKQILKKSIFEQSNFRTGKNNFKTNSRLNMFTGWSPKNYEHGFDHIWEIHFRTIQFLENRENQFGKTANDF